MSDDGSAPMSQVDVEKGLGAFLATRYNLGAGAATEVAEPEEVNDVTEEAAVADGQAETENVAEETETEAEAPAEPEFLLDLKVNGKERQITDRAEAIRLAQLGLASTERFEEASRLVSQAEEREREATRHRDQYAAYLPEIEAFLANPIGEPPKREGFPDDLSYYKAKDAYADALGKVQAVRAERERLAKEQQAEGQRKLERWVQDQDRALLAELPEWHDTSVRESEAREMLEAAKRYGISDAALQNPLLVRDKAFVLMLRDAMRYRKAADAGAAEVREAPTTGAKPGSGPQVQPRDRQRREIEKRAQSGKTADVAVAMGHLMARKLELDKQAQNARKGR
jgi:hypothetical protein